MVAQVLTVRFPTNARDLDALIGSCTMDDLDWLIRELVTAASFAPVKLSLEMRLARR